MAELDIAGLGAWSPRFATWTALADGLRGGQWTDADALLPPLIPSRERRRAPQLVKMAVEVLSQACDMAGVAAADAAVVFASAMGDMQITDHLCRTLTETPRLVSPTRFHNSVHNAAPGYWSIATGATGPATAISAFEYTATMALLEGAAQALTEQRPVLIVAQEIAASTALADICPSHEPFSAALLLAPCGSQPESIGRLQFEVRDGSCAWPALPKALRNDFDDNMSARLLPLLAAIAALPETATFDFPLSPGCLLSVSLAGPGTDRG